MIEPQPWENYLKESDEILNDPDFTDVFLDEAPTREPGKIVPAYFVRTENAVGEMLAVFEQADITILGMPKTFRVNKGGIIERLRNGRKYPHIDTSQDERALEALGVDWRKELGESAGSESGV